MRCALMSFDLLLAAPPTGARVPRIAERLASCAENFLGAALRDWVAIDPACDVRDPPGAALTQLVARAAAAGRRAGTPTTAPVLPGWPMQAPSRSAMNLN